MVAGENISKVISSWIRKINILFGIIRYSDFYFSFPKKTKILIYRKESSSEIVDFFDNKYTEILETIHESVNLLVLFVSLIKRTSYYDEYVNIVNPQLLITFADNDRNFMMISPPSSCVKVTIQNGFRSALGDIFSVLHKRGKVKSLRVDYKCFFGENVAKEMNKYVSGESVIVGSIRSNKIIKSDARKKRGVLFISTYRPNYESPDDEFTQGVTWGEYIKNQPNLLIWLKDYCGRGGIGIDILGARDNHIAEFNYYKKIFNSDSFGFHERTPDRNAYELIDKYEAIVSIDSSLGYEALSRGSKVAMFGGIRGEKYPLSTRRYGWPGEFENSGYFWTNSLERDEWKRVLDYVFNTTESKWIADCQSYIDQNIIYNYGNSKLIALFRKLDIPLNSKYIATP